LVRGLDDYEAAARLAAHGPDDLPHEPPRSLASSVLAQLRETMILVLLGAAVLTAVTGDLADCAVILLVVAVNTTAGVLQERRAVGGGRGGGAARADDADRDRRARRGAAPAPDARDRAG
jgi:Ca2+-transporting ATPase